jgi:hypothetical protein
MLPETVYKKLYSYIILNMFVNISKTSIKADLQKICECAPTHNTTYKVLTIIIWLDVHFHKDGKGFLA